MKKLKKQLHLKDLPALLIVATAFWLGIPVGAQTVPTHGTVSAADNDTTRGNWGASISSWTAITKSPSSFAKTLRWSTTKNL
jgi:hypothetical protein